MGIRWGFNPPPPVTEDSLPKHVNHNKPNRAAERGRARAAHLRTKFPGAANRSAMKKTCSVQGPPSVRGH